MSALSPLWGSRTNVRLMLGASFVGSGEVVWRWKGEFLSLGPCWCFGGYLGLEAVGVSCICCCAVVIGPVQRAV